MSINKEITIRIIDGSTQGFKALEQELVGLDPLECKAVGRKSIIPGANRVVFCSGMADGSVLLGKRNKWGVSRPHHAAKFPAATVAYLKESSNLNDEEHKAYIPSPPNVEDQLIYNGPQALGTHMMAKEAVDGMPDNTVKKIRMRGSVDEHGNNQGANSPRFVSDVVAATNGQWPAVLVGLTIWHSKG